HRRETSRCRVANRAIRSEYSCVSDELVFSVSDNRVVFLRENRGLLLREGYETRYTSSRNDANRVLKPSANPGCGKIPSRSVVYGSFPIIAIWSIDAISPPSIPNTAAPRICLESASTTAFITPRG